MTPLPGLGGSGGGTGWGAEVAALFHSLIDTARLHDVDPRDYLRAAAFAGLERRAQVLLPQDLRAQA